MTTLKTGSVIGPYIVEDKIGGGGMAVIYRAHLKHSRQLVALKVNNTLSRQNQAMSNALRQEVDILTRLNHHGVIRPYLIPLEGAKDQRYLARATQLPDQPWYYAMEYLPGKSLAEMLKSIKRLPLPIAALIGARIADSIEYIHSRGVVHLDIKPENLLLRYPLIKDSLVEPVLIDFGVAAQTKSMDAQGGTIFMMPPEYIRRMRGDLDPQISIDLKKVDVYSLGVVMYRMVTGTYPYNGLSERTLTSAILNGTLQLPSEVNPEVPNSVDDFFRQWLAKDPSMRPSIIDFKNQLTYLSAGLTRVPVDIAPANEKKSWQFWR